MTTQATAQGRLVFRRFTPDTPHSAQRFPEGGEIELWRADLRHVPTAADILSPDEQVRAGRFQFDRDRRRFTASRIFLRSVLGAYADLRPAEVPLRIAPGGKPACGELSFNLSHTDETAVLAVARRGRIGVDVETVRPLRDVDRLIASLPRERAAIEALPPTQRLNAFFACWTAKEAFLKALGVGLAEDLSSFEVSSDPAAPPRLLSTALRHGPPWAWRLVPFRIGADRLGAVAQEIVV